MTLGWAIITIGLHADVKIAPALNATPDAELVAVYSRDQGRADFIDELADFHCAIREDRAPAATGLDGLRVVQVTLAMIESARDGRTVKIEPLTV